MKISVITVCRNSEATIKDCLLSISAQTYKNIEHIVIDGASTDGTLTILHEHHAQISRLISEKDSGIYEAMNKGIAYSTGDIIGFLNSDDYYAHNQVLLEVARCFTEDESLDGCYADLIYVDKFDTSRIIRYWHSEPFKPGAFSLGWCPPHPTFFVRASLYKLYKNFDLDFRIASDVELMMRLIEVHRIRVKYLPSVWVKMRMGGETNKSIKNIIKQNKEIIFALHKWNLPINLLNFFVSKIWSRATQFLTRPYK